MNTESHNRVERHGGWIQTYSGKEFYPLDPRMEDIDILDIAHALSNMCRFGGHVRTFYSVADHSVFVSKLVEGYLRASDAQLEEIRQGAFAGLLHDASEAYLVDLPTPVKRSVVGYSTHEAFVQKLVEVKFGVEDHWPGLVKYCDEVALATEMRDLMPPRNIPNIQFAAAGRYIVPLVPTNAKHEFLTRFTDLGGRL